MSFPDLPPDLAERLSRLERVLGQRIVPRLVHLEDLRLRGRAHVQGTALLLDVNDVNPGFFWHLDVLRRLLDHLEPSNGALPWLPWEVWDD